MNIEALYRHFRSSKGICTDTRKLAVGQLFFALKGPNFNANTLAEKALDAGAKLAVVDDANVVKNDRYVLVDDALQTLQQLAFHHRKQLKATFLVIGGSNGKTTTKELMAAVLRKRYNTFATPGNFNNHIGVPLSLLQITDDVEMAVMEIGANHQGEHEALLPLVQPDFGLVTNNGKDHLEGFGSIEGVIKANLEIYDYLKAHNKGVFVNADDAILMDHSSDMERWFYGKGDKSKANLVHVELKQEFPFVQAGLHFSSGISLEIKSRLIGAFQIGNIGAAAAIGHYFQVPEAKIAEAISAYQPANNRTQVVQWKGNEVLLDAYNANPSSLGAMLDSFAQYPASKKCVIVADMLELGTHSDTEHKAMLAKLLSGQYDHILCVGPCFGKYAEEYPFTFVNSRAEAANWLSQKSLAGYSILVKGSRGFALEKLFDD